MVGKAPDLDFMVDYEIRSARRYQRFVSMVIVGHPSLDERFQTIFPDVVRDSDECFCTDRGAFVLMGETDGSGALAAIDRYKQFFEGSLDLRFGVASFPFDGSTAEELISVAMRRLDRAQNGQAGAVVAVG